MPKLTGLIPKRVFDYFNEICRIPHGSGDTAKIADYCMEFASAHNLEAQMDEYNNVIIRKPASKGYENAQPVILQGHLDMVCQKTEDSNIDFSKDGLDIYFEGDFVKAKETTLGADNGIAVAMVLAILEDDSISHPEIEAVFTTDEEIGMIGAVNMDMSVLKSRRMINVDTEAEDTVTVSCAGGIEFSALIPFEKENASGTAVNVNIKGLKGGHSGIEINSGRVNANLISGRFLKYMMSCSEFRLISVDGGDKSNAITPSGNIRLCVSDTELFVSKARECLEEIKEEIKAREPDFDYSISIEDDGTFEVMDNDSAQKLIYALVCTPNGVMEYSAEIDGLVETSLNLGILSTTESTVKISYALRSNKLSALNYLTEKLKAFYSVITDKSETFGFYPPWEYRENSLLRDLYTEIYKANIGELPNIEAIHAGLECGVFASRLDRLDCIAIGPSIYDAHTVNERLSISSTERIYKLILELLAKSK